MYFRFLKPGDPYYPNWIEMRRRTRQSWLAFAVWPFLSFLLGFALLPLGLPGIPLLWGGALAACPFFVVQWRRVYWPCPRCGRPFYYDWGYWGIFVDKCLHCGLSEYAPNEHS